MDQEQEDRRPTDLSDEPPSKKQRLNRPQLTPLINPNNVDEEQAIEQQQAGRKRKRRSRKASKKSRKSRRKSRRSRR